MRTWFHSRDKLGNCFEFDLLQPKRFRIFCLVTLWPLFFFFDCSHYAYLSASLSLFSRTCAFVPLKKKKKKKRIHSWSIFNRMVYESWLIHEFVEKYLHNVRYHHFDPLDLPPHTPEDHAKYGDFFFQREISDKIF